MDTVIVGDLIAIAILSVFISLGLLGIYLNYQEKKKGDSDKA